MVHYRRCFVRASRSEANHKEKKNSFNTARRKHKDLINGMSRILFGIRNINGIRSFAILFYFICCVFWSSMHFHSFWNNSSCMRFVFHMAHTHTLAASNRVNQNVIQPKILPANQERVFPPSFRCLHTCITALDDALSVYASEFMFFPFSNIFYLAVFGSAVGVLHHRRTMWTDAE